MSHLTPYLQIDIDIVITSNLNIWRWFSCVMLDSW